MHNKQTNLVASTRNREERARADAVTKSSPPAPMYATSCASSTRELVEVHTDNLDVALEPELRTSSDAPAAISMPSGVDPDEPFGSRGSFVGEVTGLLETLAVPCADAAESRILGPLANPVAPEPEGA